LPHGAADVDVNVAADAQSVIVTITIDGGNAFTPGFDLEAQAQHQAFLLTNQTP